jgi:quercetin dioxygenase-like cupin family protein
MRLRPLIILAVGIGAFVLGGGVVSAEPPSGVAAKILASGTLSKATDIGANGIEFTSRRATQVIVQQGDFSAAGTSGWHTHPGLTIVTVTDGTVTYHRRCSVGSYTKGQSFVEPPDTPVMVENSSNQASAQVVTALMVPAGFAARTNVSAPECPNHTED